MGALHDGHLALVARARQLADIVVVSIFVNPLQFGEASDLDRYPRSLDSDLGMLQTLGVQLVFAPSAAEMYPNGAAQTRIAAGESAVAFEGRSRPGHFDGVLTVVDKLLNIVQPNVILFGQKDAQQVFVVERMVADLDIDVDVVSVPTVREPDGLALSSRNRFLGASEREAALALATALQEAVSAAVEGTDAALAAAHAALSREPLVELDYLEVVDPASFAPVAVGYRGAALAIIAAQVGDTRLIDNATLEVG